MLGDLVSTFTRMVPYRFSGETVACALCGGTDHEVIGRRDRYGHRLKTVLCRRCGLIFTNPRPTEAEIAHYYRRSYRQHYHHAATPRKKRLLRGVRGARSRYAYLAPILGEGSRAVDVGSGAGEFVAHLCSKGVDAVGIEPNEGYAQYAQRRYGVQIINSGWEDADIAEASVDIVTVHHVLDHFRDPLAALRRFSSWLKPEGCLYVSVRDVHMLERTPYARFHFAHLHNFNHASLVMMALRANLAIEPRFGCDSTALVFRKLVAPPDQWMIFPNNYALLSRFFREHTNVKYFLTLTCYTRWVRRMVRLSSNLVTAPFVRL
jgi:SAM-dependent methyltransferase